MLDVTNISKCKEMAIILLHSVTITETAIPTIISHPFFNSSILYDCETQDILNILESDENLDKALQIMEENIEKANTYNELLLIVNKPYRLLFFNLTHLLLSDVDYNNGLLYCFTSDECANMNVNVSKNELVQLFKNTTPNLIMSDDDLVTYNKLPNIITVYRGVTNYNGNNVKALSWTLDLDKARWFANRFKEYDGKVYKAEIAKSDVFVYCDDRNEKEIILNYRKLKNIECVECIE